MAMMNAAKPPYDQQGINGGNPRLKGIHPATGQPMAHGIPAPNPNQSAWNQMMSPDARLARGGAPPGQLQFGAINSAGVHPSNRFTADGRQVAFSPRTMAALDPNSAANQAARASHNYSFGYRGGSPSAPQQDVNQMAQSALQNRLGSLSPLEAQGRLSWLTSPAGANTNRPQNYAGSLQQQLDQQETAYLQQMIGRDSGRTPTTTQFQGGTVQSNIAPVTATGQAVNPMANRAAPTAANAVRPAWMNDQQWNMQQELRQWYDRGNQGATPLADNLWQQFGFGGVQDEHNQLLRGRR